MCPTGLPELTTALAGGFQTPEIVEFSGDSETRKTDLCYLLCVCVLSHSLYSIESRRPCFPITTTQDCFAALIIMQASTALANLGSISSK